MAIPTTLARPFLAFLSSESVLIDSSGIVNPHTLVPFTEVDVSHFDDIVISDAWGDVSFSALLKDLYIRFEEANLSYHISDDIPKEYVKTKVYEVGSSAAYDAYNSKRDVLNKALPQSLRDKCDQIDLHPSNDRDMRFQVNKNTVVRAEELFLAALQKTCPNFNRSLFKWREKFYDFKDNVFVLSIKDKFEKQYDFYIFETCKRTFFSSRDAAQVDVTPYVESKLPAKLIVHDFHPIQPYIDRIDRTLRIPEPEKVNHHGFLLQLYYVMKGYNNPDPRAEGILKETLINYLKTHNLNDLISKFIGNHPSDNGFAFIFSVRSKLCLSISSPIPGYTPGHLSVCAQLLCPTEKKINYNGQDYFLNAPSVDDLRGFNWNFDLIKNLNILNSILEFEEREPLNPSAKAMFDSYSASLNDEQRLSALKIRVLRFANTERRALVVMQTISSSKLQLPPDLLSIVANYADETQYGLIINDLSRPEWIQSNVEKACNVFEWILNSKNKDRVYPFLKCLIPYCDQKKIAAFFRRTWEINPNMDELIGLQEVLEKRGSSLSAIFDVNEKEMAPHFSTSREFIIVLGYARTLEGKIALFRLYAKEDRKKAIQYAIEQKITGSVLQELLPLFRNTDTFADISLVTQIAASCTASQFDQLINYLPPSWMAALPTRAKEVFNWLVSEKKTICLISLCNAAAYSMHKNRLQ